MRLWWLQRAAALLLWNVLHKRCVHTKLCWEAFVSHLSRVWGLVVVMHQEGFVWISRAWRIPLRHAETHIHTHTHTRFYTKRGQRECAIKHKSNPFVEFNKFKLKFQSSSLVLCQKIEAAVILPLIAVSPSTPAWIVDGIYLIYIFAKRNTNY